MRAPRASDDVVPVSEFKAQTSEWLRRVAASGHAVVITQHGKRAGVLLSPRAYDALTERARFVEAVHEGLADSDAGRWTDHASVVTEAKRRGPQRKPASSTACAKTRSRC